MRTRSPSWPRTTAASLEGLEKNTEVKLCGVLTGITRKRNKEGKPWAAMTHRGPRPGSVEAMVFTTSYERLAPQIVEDKAVLVRGLVLPEENAPPKISVQDIVPLDNARVDLPSVISIRVWLGRNGGVDRAHALEELFKRKPGDTAGAAAAGIAARLLGAAGRSRQGPPGQGIPGRGGSDLRFGSDRTGCRVRCGYCLTSASMASSSLPASDQRPCAASSR